jgi:hypothetical protein
VRLSLLLLIVVVVLSKLILLRIVVSPRLELYAVEDVLSSRLLLFRLSFMSFSLLTSLVAGWRFFEGDAGGNEVSMGSPSPVSPLLFPGLIGIAMFRIFSSCLRSKKIIV